MESWRERWRNWWRKPQVAATASTAVVWHLQVQRERGAVGRLNDRLELNLRPSVPDTALRAVQVALDELLTNAIMHAENATGAIDMKLARSPGVLDVTVSYLAAPFDPTKFASAATSKTIEASQIGGHGIRLVRELMDEFRYEYIDGRNVMHLRKRC